MPKLEGNKYILIKMEIADKRPKRAQDTDNKQIKNDAHGIPEGERFVKKIPQGNVPQPPFAHIPLLLISRFTGLLTPSRLFRDPIRSAGRQEEGGRRLKWYTAFQNLPLACVLPMVLSRVT